VASDLYSELGAALLGGVVVAIALLLVERHREAQAVHRDLLLRLSLLEDLDEMDLRNQDASGVHLPRRHLNNARLTNSVLRDAVFIGAELCSVDAMHADLSRAQLVRAHLDGSRFVRANLSRADLSGAFASAPVEDVLSLGTVFGRRIGVSFKGATLRKARLTKAVLHDADLSLSDMRRADLSGAQLDGANLREARLDGCVAEGTWFGLVDEYANGDLNSSESVVVEPCYAHGVRAPRHWTRAAVGCGQGTD